MTPAPKPLSAETLKAMEEKAKVIANSLAIKEDWSIGSQMWMAARLGAFKALSDIAALTPTATDEVERTAEAWLSAWSLS